MNRSNISHQHDDEPVSDREPDTTSEREGISPLNPSTFPRAEEDEETRARSTDFHDVPDPGPNVGRENEESRRSRPS